MSLRSVPGSQVRDLVVVETDFVLGRSETFLDGPACPGHADEFTESCTVRVVAVVESEFTIIDGPADQVLVVGVGGVDERPVIDPGPFRADSAGGGAAAPRSCRPKATRDRGGR